MPQEIVIGDNTPLNAPELNGGMKGLIPRDYNTHPQGFYKSAPPAQLTLIPRSEWSDRIREKKAAKSQLSDIRNRGNNGQPIPSLNQGSVGYCWAHSTTQCVHLLRAMMNVPYVPLSAYAVAATIKKGADEGGWGAQSMDFICERGVPSQALWPQGDRNYRQYDKPEVWENAALHKVTEGWVDLNAAQYDRKLTFDQEGTCLLTNGPVVGDFNDWSHSVALMDLVDGVAEYGNYRNPMSHKLLTLQEHELLFGINNPLTGGFAVRLLNSWGDEWSENGAGIRAGDKAIIDGGVAVLSTVPSDK